MGARRNPRCVGGGRAYRRPRVQARRPASPMIQAILTLSPVAVLAVALLGFCLGAIWYSPLLFVKAWMEEMKITPESAKAGSGRFGRVMAGAVLCTVVSTFTLAALLAAHRVQGVLKGAELGLLVGAGLVAAREGTNALFEGRTLRHFLITAGHDVALCVVQGAILAVWR